MGEASGKTVALASNSISPLPPEQKAAIGVGTDFPDWYISLSFGKSRSAAYPQAVALAKMATKYLEHDIDGKPLHQAIYSDEPKEYLKFIKLYELVSGWKSCFVVINGHLPHFRWRTELLLRGQMPIRESGVLLWRESPNGEPLWLSSLPDQRMEQSLVDVWRDGPLRDMARR